MVLLLLLMMLKRALSLPSSCRCGGISEGRFFHHQVSGGKISLNLRKSDLSSCIVKKKSVLLPSSSVFRKGKEDKEDKGAREKYFRSSIQRTRERTERDRIEISFSTIYTTLLVEKIKYTNCSFFTEYYKAARILSSRRRE